MDSKNNLAQAMNNISLDDDEEEEINGDSHQIEGFDAKLCVVGRFITEGRVNFRAMQQTLAALWRPGRGVYIKDLDTNLFLFQFYHEVDVKRVMEGCPWSFNRRALIMARLKDGENPRCVELNNMELWVQIHHLKVGFMSEKVLKEIGDCIGRYVESCPSNFVGVWREYMRIRVSINLAKPLKRRLKVRTAGDDWFWTNFKYENVPTFCFICGMVGHSERFCSRLFDTPENEIIRPYGAWMRAPFKRQVKPIGAKWLRNGMDGDSHGFNAGGQRNQTEDGTDNQDPKLVPKNKEVIDNRDNHADRHFLATE